MSDPQLIALFGDQHGLVTRKQALSQGLSDTQIRYRLRSGIWSAPHAGIYRHALSPRTWQSDALLGVLATGGVASHLTAARLHRFKELPRPIRSEVTVVHGRQRRVGRVTVHQSTQLDRVDRTEIDAVACTGLSRTVLDVGARLRPLQLGAVVDALIRTKRISFPQLWDVLIRHSVRGRDGCGVLREVLEDRSPDKAIPLSDWSRMVNRLLSSAGLEPAVFEYRVHDDRGRFIGQVDLAYPAARLAIELDSVAFHFNLQAFRRDRSRVRALTIAGWTTLQFTWQDYRDRPDALVAQVRELATLPAAEAATGT